MDLFLAEKNAPRQLSRATRSLIQLIGDTRTREREEQIIHKEIRDLREKIAQNSINNNADMMVKLIYFQTMGYSTKFAHIIPINLCQSANLYQKKMAYLLAAMLIKPGESLALLMNNTLLKDLQNENLFVIMIAINMLRYFINKDLAQMVLPLLEKLLKHPQGMIRRKALLAVHHIYAHCPHLVKDIKGILDNAFKDPDTPVVFAAVSILRQLIADGPHQYKKFVPKCAEILFSIVDHRYPQQYDYHKMPAPWHQIWLLQILEKLGRNDQTASALMTQALQKALKRCMHFTMPFNKGILQQCIKTICSIYPNPNLLQKCCNYIHKFFQTPDNNMNYFGICCLLELSRSNREVLSRWEGFLLQCLDSADITLAEKTVQLLTQIAHQDNTELVLDRIMKLAQKSTDETEKRNLIKRAIILVEKFSNDRILFLRRMNEIFYKFECFVTEKGIDNFIKVLIQIASLDSSFPLTALKTYIEILLHFRNPTLVKVSAWAIGEFACTLHSTAEAHEKDEANHIVDQSVQALLGVVNQYSNEQQTTFLVLSALMKLTQVGMTSKHEEIKRVLETMESNQSFFIHKAAEEFIRMAKYASALADSLSLDFDPKMAFLAKYIDSNYEHNQPKYLVRKTANERKGSLIEEFDGQTKFSKAEIFNFKTAKRWNTDTGNVEAQTKEVKISELESKKDEKFTLRGPHEGIKNAKNPNDKKKLKLAKSLFGKRY